MQNILYMCDGIRESKKISLHVNGGDREYRDPIQNTNYVGDGFLNTRSQISLLVDDRVPDCKDPFQNTPHIGDGVCEFKNLERDLLMWVMGFPAARVQRNLAPCG